MKFFKRLSMIMGFVLIAHINLSAASQTEINALAALYNSTDGANWNLDTNWTIGDPCQNNWEGVGCNLQGDITTLTLGANGLAGTIPSVIGDLTHLTRLDLGRNNDGLTGNIPTEIGDLIYLEWLDLSSNNLTGSIPAEIGDLMNLTQLFLGSNNLTGSIPAEIGNLTGLLVLDLYGNRLTDLSQWRLEIL